MGILLWTDRANRKRKLRFHEAAAAPGSMARSILAASSYGVCYLSDD